MSAMVLTTVRDSDWPAVNVILAPQSSNSRREFKRGPAYDCQSSASLGSQQGSIRHHVSHRERFGSAVSLSLPPSRRLHRDVSRFRVSRFRVSRRRVSVRGRLGFLGRTWGWWEWPFPQPRYPVTLSGARAALTPPRFRVSASDEADAFRVWSGDPGDSPVDGPVWRIRVKERAVLLRQPASACFGRPPAPASASSQRQIQPPASACFGRQPAASASSGRQQATAFCFGSQPAPASAARQRLLKQPASACFGRQPAPASAVSQRLLSASAAS
jgi:hypothetical protein